MKSLASGPGAFSRLDEKLRSDSAPVVDRPLRVSFEEFLLKDARVPIGGGEHGPYTFEGRQAILGIVRRIDAILSDSPETALTDSLLGVAGGAQWGKTILELNLAAYLTSQRWLAAGLFLPSDDLVQGIVDTKLRPDVIDQIPWFAEMTQVGKAVNKSGKTANRKGAFLVTDGRRKTTGMVLGLQKIPTSYTFDVTLQDEVDDIPEKNAKYVKGRRTASKLRFDVRIGTQRVHGRGQNRVWKNGSQGVVILGSVNDVNAALDTVPGSEVTECPVGWINPEEAFPGIIRCVAHGLPSEDDPKLTWTGDFKRDGSDEVVATHNPLNLYYLADPETGEPLDRRHPLWLHRAPEKFTQRNFTYRAAQLGFDAIGLSQIVAQFQLAVTDPDEMTVFRCDVLALPQSTAQALTPSILDRARTVDPFDMRMRTEPDRKAFAGLDTGDRCYFFTRERESAATKRMIYAGTITAGDMVTRAASLFEQLGLSALFVDQRPLVSQARSLALKLNGLETITDWPEAPAESNRDAWINFPSGLTWDGRNGRWRNLRCAVVRFDKSRLGAGIEQGFDIFEEAGQTKFVPVIRCNRYETIDRAVREFLTPSESVVEVVEGGVRELPAMLLPRAASSPVLTQIDEHLVTGSERAKEKDGTLGDYVDQVANHFLLADGYSALAELIAGEAPGRGAAKPFTPIQRGGNRTRAARNREVLA